MIVAMDAYVGSRFGKLVVIEDVPQTRGRRRVRCRCDCGNEITPLLSNVLDGNTKSCGCEKRRGGRNATHRQSKTKLYRVWSMMKDRCANPRSKRFAYYGGRGIRVCDRWRNSFEAFVADMGEPPFDGATLDRIDIDGHYEPGNVRWATWREQALNRRPSYEYRGRQMTWSELVAASGLRPVTLRKRIESGWTIERAVETPVVWRGQSHG